MYPLKVLDRMFRGILKKISNETVERAVSGFILNSCSKKKIMMNRVNEPSTMDVKKVRYMLRIVVSLTPSLQFRKSIRFFASLLLTSSLVKWLSRWLWVLDYLPLGSNSFISFSSSSFFTSSFAGELVRANFSFLTIRFNDCYSSTVNFECNIVS